MHFIPQELAILELRDAHSHTAIGMLHSPIAASLSTAFLNILAKAPPLF